MDQASAEAGAQKPAAASRADVRRAQVLDAAMICFGLHGFHGASMNDLAAEAAMSVGQIYRYFENKEAIIAAIVARDLDEAGERMAAVRARSGDIIEELVAIAKFKVELLSDPKRTSLALEILAEATRNPRVSEIVRAADETSRARLSDVLARCSANIDPQCLEARMDMLAMLIDGWIVRVAKNPDVDKDVYFASLRPLFRILVFGEAAIRCE
jgi:AcrR family transcriptional regulator